MEGTWKAPGRHMEGTWGTWKAHGRGICSSDVLETSAGEERKELALNKIVVPGIAALAIGKNQIIRFRKS